MEVQTNGEAAAAKPAAPEPASKPAAEKPAAEKPPAVEVPDEKESALASRNDYNDLKSPTPGKNYAPPSIPKSVQRKQELYSSGKPSTVHSKEKLMRSEGIIPVQVCR